MRRDRCVKRGSQWNNGGQGLTGSCMTSSLPLWPLPLPSALDPRDQDTTPEPWTQAGWSSEPPPHGHTRLGTESWQTELPALPAGFAWRWSVPAVAFSGRLGWGQEIRTFGWPEIPCSASADARFWEGMGCWQGSSGYSSPQTNGVLIPSTSRPHSVPLGNGFSLCLSLGGLLPHPEENWL